MICIARPKGRALYVSSRNQWGYRENLYTFNMKTFCLNPWVGDDNTVIFQAGFEDLSSITARNV